MHLDLFSSEIRINCVSFGVINYESIPVYFWEPFFSHTYGPGDHSHISRFPFAVALPARRTAKEKPITASIWFLLGCFLGWEKSGRRIVCWTTTGDRCNSIIITGNFINIFKITIDGWGWWSWVEIPKPKNHVFFWWFMCIDIFKRHIFNGQAVNSVS